MSNDYSCETAAIVVAAKESQSIFFAMVGRRVEEVSTVLGKLIPCGGGAPIPLLKESLLLGRKPDCDIPISCSSVSGRHCHLEFKDGAWWVRDLDSKNGTAINGRRVSTQRITPLDILTIGRQRLVVDYQSTEPIPGKSSKSKSARSKSSRRGADDDLALAFLNLPMEDEEPAVNAPLEQISPPELAAKVPPVATPLPVTPILAIPTLESKPRPAPATDLGRLIPVGGGTPIVLTATELILGRGRNCDIPIRLPSISSRHCKLIMKEGYWHVEDLNSTNGTWVDGDRCLFECLMPDSILALDKHRFTIQYVPQGDGPPPIVRQLFTQSLLEKAGLAQDFSEDRLGGEELPEDDLDRPKRYELLDSDADLR